MRRGWVGALAVACAVVLVVGGYVVGARPADRGDGPSCAEVRRTVEDLFGDWAKRGTSDQVGPMRVRTAADIVAEHGDCYPYAARSAVRAAVQQLDVAVESNPMQYAAGLVACEAVVEDPAACRDREGSGS
ncbi:hypothetical protein [Streptomyces sp. NPDC058955]|uniref:hypothetical protein n=1 Tax=unclassified Streptomyces TaxID=2593676 RepID=UPI0036591065